MKKVFIALLAVFLIFGNQPIDKNIVESVDEFDYAAITAKIGSKVGDIANFMIDNLELFKEKYNENESKMPLPPLHMNLLNRWR